MTAKGQPGEWYWHIQLCVACERKLMGFLGLQKTRVKMETKDEVLYLTPEKLQTGAVSHQMQEIKNASS